MEIDIISDLGKKSSFWLAYRTGDILYSFFWWYKSSMIDLGIHNQYSVFI